MEIRNTQSIMKEIKHLSYRYEKCSEISEKLIYFYQLILHINKNFEYLPTNKTKYFRELQENIIQNKIQLSRYCNMFPDYQDIVKILDILSRRIHLFT